MAEYTKDYGPDGQASPVLEWIGALSRSGGKLYITPTLGSDVVVNGTFDADTDWGTHTAWTISGGIATAVNAEGTSYLRNISTVSVNTWYSGTVDATRTSGVLRMYVDDAGNMYSLYSTSGSFVFTGRSKASSPGRPSAVGANTFNGTVDNLVLKPLTLSSLFSSVSTSDADVIADANVTLTAGTQAGLVLNLDSTASPANFLIGYLDGTNFKLDKCVGGTYTNLITVATSGVASKLIQVITYHSGTYLKVRCYVDNVMKGGEQTVADAGIVSNTKHGCFSTYASNTFDNFVIFARGTDGEYETALNAF